MTRFRRTDESDSIFLKKFIDSDPEHFQTSSVSFWLPPEDEKSQHKGVKYLAVEDEKGIIGYLVLENCLRIHVQFAPPSEIERTRAGLSDALPQIQKWARDQYKQIIFESQSLALIWFLRKFGFRKSKNEIICNL